MGRLANDIYCHRLHRIAISILIIVIYSSSHLRLFNAEGRRLTQTAGNSKLIRPSPRHGFVINKAILRGRIGSQPPRCERRCSSCGHCEAIEVPTNPQTRRRGEIANSTLDSAVRGDDDNSNYKPMSWKCKCGNLVFNP